MGHSNIPTVDLSPFFNEEGDEHGKSKGVETIAKACSEYGFFQIMNHGMPSDLMNKALQLSKTFFQYPHEEKLKSSPGPGAPLPAGYSKQPDHSTEKNEYLLVFSPGSSFNVYPENPPELRSVIEEVFSHLVKVGSLLESIINDCLGLPPNFLQEYNHDRSWDIMVALRYFPPTESETNVFAAHEDTNCITFVFQDEVGGLEVCKEGEWIPVVPAEGKIVVIVGDVIQMSLNRCYIFVFARPRYLVEKVLSNKRFRSATHRVVRSKGRSRHSFAFFYNLHGDKWVEPLPQFTTEIGESPKYRGFLFKEYQQTRVRNRTHPPSRPEDVINITHYAIDT